jgi:Rha family phage regulatory protein
MSRDGQQWTTSLNMAEVFRKNHGKIIGKIEDAQCSQEFNQANFGLVEYQDRKGEMRPMYEMTKDGFSFIAMGFTGKKAAQFKEAYIGCSLFWGSK